MFLVAVLIISLGLCSTVFSSENDNYTWNGGGYGTPEVKSWDWWGWGWRSPYPDTGPGHYSNWGAYGNFGGPGYSRPGLGPAFTHGRNATFTATGDTSTYIYTTAFVPNYHNPLEIPTPPTIYPSTVPRHWTDWVNPASRAWWTPAIYNDRYYNDLDQYGNPTGTTKLYHDTFRTLVNDWYIEGGNWQYTGDGVLGDALHITGNAGTIQFGARAGGSSNSVFTFGHGISFQAGTISFTGNNVFDKYIWEIDAQEATRWRNTIFVQRKPTDDGVITRRFHRTLTTDGANPTYLLQHRFDVDENVILELASPQRYKTQIHDVEAFQSDPDSEFYIRGGAIYIRLNANIQRGTHLEGDRPGAWDFIDNRAFRGGAIYSEQNLLLEGNSLFDGNYASHRGGAVYMAGSLAGTLELNTTNGDIAFRNNVSYQTMDPKKVHTDGVVYKTDKAGNFIDSNGAIITNPATQGGVVYSAVLDAVHLKQNTDVVFTGNRRVYFEDSLTSGNSPDDDGFNTLRLDLRNDRSDEISETDVINAKDAFVQFGSDTVNVLNPTSKDGGTVNIDLGELRLLNGGQFYTYGLGKATFTVAEHGRIGGGGTGGFWTETNNSAIIGAADGFFISGTISPDNYVFTIPNNLDGSSSISRPVSEAIGYLNMLGNVELKSATFKVDLGTDLLSGVAAFSGAAADLKNSDIVMVDAIPQTTSSGFIYLNTKTTSTDADGNLVVEDGRSSVDIGTWSGEGRYVIAMSKMGIKSVDGLDINNDNISDYFHEIIPEGVTATQNQRRSAMLSIEHNLLFGGPATDVEVDLVVKTTDDGNVGLVWTGNDQRDPLVWDEGTSGMFNWKRRGTDITIPLQFNNGDHVYFNQADNVDKTSEQLIVRPIGDWTVAGMTVEGGTYFFDSGKIIGSTTASNGLNATGRLDIEWSDTTAEKTEAFLAIETDFEKGNRINNATVHLGFDNSLGEYVASTSNERGTITVSNSQATIVTSIFGDDRHLQNHFELLGAAHLILDIPTGRELIIEGVDTSLSSLPAGATHQGGVFFLSQDASFERTSVAGEKLSKMTLKNNTAQYGGAIYAEQNLTIQGNTLFENNTAVVKGGALYLDGKGTLSTVELATGDLATGGDIVFSGNRQDDGANAIYLNKNIQLIASGEHNIFVDDGIATGSQARNNFRKTGSGIIQFQGNNILNNDTLTSGGNVEINGGTFRIAGGGSFVSEARQSSAGFTFAAGTTLAGDGTLKVATRQTYGFSFTGATISPDNDVLYSGLNNMQAHLKVGELNDGLRIGTLDLDLTPVGGNTDRSNVLLDSVTLQIDVGAGGAISGVSDRINVISGQVVLNKSASEIIVNVATLKGAQTSGDYLIMTATDGFIGIDNPSVVNPQDLLSYFKELEQTDRQVGKLQFRESVSGSGVYDQLWIQGYAGGMNKLLYWTGRNSVDWDAQVTENWVYASDRSDAMFYDGDYVLFNDRVASVMNTDVSLTENVTVIGMDFESGNYTLGDAGRNFTISGRKSGSGSYDNTTKPATGQLRIGGFGNEAAVKISVATDFDNGTRLGTDGTVTINHAQALGAYDHQNYLDYVANDTTNTARSMQGYVDVVGASTVKVDADTRSAASIVQNRFNVANELTFDLGENSKLVFNGVDVTSNAANGGAMYVTAAGSVVFDQDGTGELSFTGNSAGNGGAIYTEANLELVSPGVLSFSNNQALSDGGAVYARGDLTVGGESKWIGNTAGRNGGAIYMAGGASSSSPTTLTLDAENGDIIFTGNTATSGGEAIYAAKNTTISLLGDRANAMIFIDDSVLADGTGNALVVGMSGTDAQAIFNETSTIKGSTSVNDGTLFLAGTKTLTSDSFSVGTDGVLAGSGTFAITGTGTFQIAGTLDPNSDSYVSDAAGKVTKTTTPIGTMYFDGNVAFNNATINVDLNTSTSLADFIDVSGNISVATATDFRVSSLNGMTAGTTYEFDLMRGANTLNDYFDRLGTTGSLGSGDRFSATLEKKADDRTVVLKVTLGDNGNLYWTGDSEGSPDGTWYSGNMIVKNWALGSVTGGETSFIDGDRVYFTENNAVLTKDVTLDTLVKVAAMDVTGGEYTFMNGTISGRGTTSLTVPRNLTISGAGTTATFESTQIDFEGNLIVRDGAAATINTGSTIDGGTILNAGTVTINHNQALDTYAGGGTRGTVSIEGDSTIKLGDSVTSVTNDFDVKAGKTLTVETNGLASSGVAFNGPGTMALNTGGNLILNVKQADDTVTFNQSIGGTAGGNVTMLGNGLVIFKNTTNNINGNLQLNGGLLQVADGANLNVSGSGGITINGGGLGGEGVVNVLGGTVNVVNGVLSAGDGTNKVGEFTIAGGNVVFGNATLKVDIAGTECDVIHVTGGGVSFANAASRENTVDISVQNWVVGTSYLIMDTRDGFSGTSEQDILAHFNVKSQGQDLGARQSASLSLQDNNHELWLTIEDVGSIGIVWTGKLGNNWNVSQNNWYAENDPTKDPLNFMTNDLVIFRQADASQNDINVESDVTVSGMIVENGTFTYSGAAINGVYGSSIGNGKLEIATKGEANVTINNETNFVNGTDIVGKATVVLGNEKALGATDTTNSGQGVVNIASTANATIKTDGRGRKISNRFRVDAGGKLSLEGTENGILTVTNLVKSTEDGGAVRSLGDLTVKGPIFFIENETDGDGGAIFMGAGTTLLLNSSLGDIIFQDNKAAGKDNSVHLSDDASLVIDGENTVTFRDPLSGGENIRFTKNGSGTVQFLKDTVFSSTAAAELNEGTLRLIENASIDFGTNASFRANGGVLEGDGTIRAVAGNYIGGTVSPGNDEVDEFGTLSFVGDTVFDNATFLADLGTNGTSDRIMVDGSVDYTGNNTLSIQQWVSNGTFDLIYSDLNGMTDPTGKWTIKIGSQDINANDRFSATLQMVNDGTRDILQLTTEGSNAMLIWTGAENRIWDSETQNWKNDADKKEIFVYGDSVYFTGLGQGNIMLNDSTVVADMTITGGEYAFTGGALFGRAGISTLADTKGELNILGGKATFDVAADFEGNINIAGSSVVVQTENGSFATQGKFVLGADATLGLTPKTHAIVADSVTLDGTVVVGTPSSTDTTIDDVIVANNTLDEVRLSEIFNVSHALTMQEALFSADSLKMSLAFRRLGLGEFADLNNMSWNEKEAAGGLDKVFAAGEWGDFQSLLYELDSNAEVAYVIDNLRGTEQAADAIFSSLWDPWKNVFKQIDAIEKCLPSEGTRGQAPQALRGRNVWVEGYYRYMHAWGDGNARRYRESRGGLMTGIDTQLGHFTTLGVTFGYGNPRMHSQFGKIETDDYTMALYGKTRLVGDAYMLGFLGYGTQRYDYKRNSMYDVNTSEFDGDAMYISFEFVQPVRWNEHAMLFPLIAIEYQRAWMDAFVEQGDFLAQDVKSSNMDRFTARIGVNSKIRYADRFNFTTRLQYAYTFMGDTHGEIRSTFAGTTSAPGMVFKGIDIGRSKLNLGLGGEALLGKCKRIRLFLDYDFDCGEHRTAHTGEFGTSVVW